MSSILPSSYYQLNNVFSGQQQTSTDSGSTTTSAASLTQSLIDSLNGVDGNTAQSASSSAAYSLNLSPAAQLLMGGSSSNSSLPSQSRSFALTQQQEQTITDILNKYKNAPLTQDTFNQIQNDLEAAGLGSDQLSAQDEINSFNGTQTLIDDLNGNTNNSMVNPTTTLSNEQTKTANYMQSIISQWKNISGASLTSGS